MSEINFDVREKVFAPSLRDCSSFLLAYPGLRLARDARRLVLG